MGELFNKKRLVAKNDTRWNSIYLMLKRFLELKDALTPTLAIKLPEKQLTASDWKLMEKVVNSLESFEKVCNCLVSEIYVQKLLGKR